MGRNFFFFFDLIWVLWPFQEYFTYIEQIVHQRWRKLENPGKTTWPSISRTWLSHMWPEGGSNDSSEKPNGLRVSQLSHSIGYGGPPVCRKAILVISLVKHSRNAMKSHNFTFAINLHLCMDWTPHLGCIFLVAKGKNQADQTLGKLHWQEILKQTTRYIMTELIWKYSSSSIKLLQNHAVFR